MAGFYDTPSYALSVAVVGDRGYVGDMQAGFYIVDLLGAGVEERAARDVLRATQQTGPTVVRGVLELPDGPSLKPQASSCLLNAAGRRVLELHPGANDVSGLAPGIYFVSGQLVRKVVIRR